MLFDAALPEDFRREGCGKIFLDCRYFRRLHYRTFGCVVSLKHY